MPLLLLVLFVCLCACIQVMFIWICAQWEEYHTGIMLYGNEYFGVLECNYSLAAIHLMTAIIGTELYEQKIGDYIDLPIIGNMCE